MRGPRAILSVLVLLLSLPASAAPGSLDTSLYARLLSRYTRNTRDIGDLAGTRVDYQGLAASRDWDRLRASLAASRPERLRTPAEKLAFWINAYNILAIDLVLREYPVSSIKDAGSWFSSVWGIEAGTIGGEGHSLDRVEDERLRPLGDPRMHAAIVCASVSCPALRREPYEAPRLDAQLDDAMRRWLSSPRKGFRLDRAGRVITLSRVFRWFESDFNPRGGVLPFLQPYLSPSDRAWVASHAAEARIRYFEYDWGLNDLAGVWRASRPERRPGSGGPG